MSDGPEPMDEDEGRDGIPLPPEIATRTRCYKLNLDSDISPQQNIFLGPFNDNPPPLTYSSSEDSSEKMNPTQVAIQTAKIFRGITVAKDGTILSQNARATRSNRGQKNKRGEKSRQATKIEKAKDLVEETILTGKVRNGCPKLFMLCIMSFVSYSHDSVLFLQAPDSDEPANMMSLVSVGEYDDMKLLVRDGSKKLREAAELGDDALLTLNRPRSGSSPGSFAVSPRKRMSPNYIAGQRAAAAHTPNKTRSIGGGLPQSVPPKLKGHPRDRPSTRKLDDKSRLREYGDESGRLSGVAAADWGGALSFSRGFHSIWNCGGTGEDTGTTSPTQVVTSSDGKSPHPMSGMANSNYRPIFEGRDNGFGPREGGVATRAN